MRARYMLKEALTNIRRNALIVLGAILAAFLTLLLSLSAVVLTEVVRSNTARWEDGVRVVAFLNQELSFDAVTALREEVQGWENVDEVLYFSKQDAYEEALEMFRDEPAFLEVIEEDPTFLPASLRIKPVDSESYASIGDRLEATPGILEVQRADAAIERVRDFKSLLTQLSLGAAIVLGVTAVALIANTIRMAIYARRDEISIMKLVGAGNWFIRVPFLLEGMLEGLVGGALAVGLMFGVHQLSLDWQDQLPDWIDPQVSVEFLARWSMLTLLGGVVVGILGSGIALRRFLRD